MKIWWWRYVYARPRFSRESILRIRQLADMHGEDSRAVANAIRDGFRWVPWWQR